MASRIASSPAAIAVLAVVLVAVSGAGSKDPILSYKALESPFRMQNMNQIWDKARPKLSEYKLKLLHYELKAHTEEEMALKKLLAEAGDGDGLRELEVRARLNRILSHYGLSSPGSGPKSGNEQKPAVATGKRMFKDKKLDRLWEKALAAGTMGDEELMLLKEEFQLYERKVDEYNRLAEASGKDPLNVRHIRNDIDDDDDVIHKGTGTKRANALNEENEMKLDVEHGYHRLHQMATRTNTSARPFSDPKVDGLWRLAQEAEFTSEELELLRADMKHYEHRLDKLRRMRAELQLMDERRGDGWGGGDMPSEGGEDDKTDFRKRMDRKVKHLSEAVEKVHSSLERKIISRHSEL